MNNINNINNGGQGKKKKKSTSPNPTFFSNAGDTSRDGSRFDSIGSASPGFTDRSLFASARYSDLLGGDGYDDGLGDGLGGRFGNNGIGSTGLNDGLGDSFATDLMGSLGSLGSLSMSSALGEGLSEDHHDGYERNSTNRSTRTTSRTHLRLPSPRESSVGGTGGLEGERYDVGTGGYKGMASPTELPWDGYGGRNDDIDLYMYVEKSIENLSSPFYDTNSSLLNDNSL